jgi:hypothetical protein
MATGVSSWSQTPGNNDIADSAVNFVEGQAASSLNNSCRGLMASVAKWRDDLSGGIVTGGTSTAYTATSNQSFASLAALDGQELTVRFNLANGTSPTLALDGLTAKPIQVDTATAVASGALKLGSVWEMVYNNSTGAYLLKGGPQASPAFTSIAVSGAITAGSVSAGGYGVITATSVSTSGDINVSGALSVTGSATAASVAGGAIATQAEQETSTSTTKIVTPGRQQFHPSAAKAWTFCDTAGSNLAGYNVSSITDTGTGIADVNLTTAFSSGNYAAIMAIGNVSGLFGTYNINSASQIRMRSFNISAANADPSTYALSVFGDQ